MTYLSKERTVF